MIKQNIGKNIKKHRKMCGLTQSELAEHLGISNKTICSWEIDRTEPTMQYIDQMCHVFNCTRTELVGIDSSFSADNAHLVALLRNDSRLTEALKIYFCLSEKKKDKVIEFIHLLDD
jgi:DNA-binding XRE family transcriptional regulator